MVVIESISFWGSDVRQGLPEFYWGRDKGSCVASFESLCRPILRSNYCANARISYCDVEGISFLWAGRLPKIIVQCHFLKKSKGATVCKGRGYNTKNWLWIGKGVTHECLIDGKPGCRSYDCRSSGHFHYPRVALDIVAIWHLGVSIYLLGLCWIEDLLIDIRRHGSPSHDDAGYLAR